jgi:cystathionine beta-lyase/cystathionine gamma-synthase
VRQRTTCARIADREPELGRPLAPVIVPSSTFVFDDQESVERYYERGAGYVYSRYENPTVQLVEQGVARLEGAEAAACFGSGMGAISTTLLAHLAAGERVAAQRELYGGAAGLFERLLPELGVDVVLFGLDEIAALEPARVEGCRLLYLETPVNPTLRIVDLRRAAEVAHRAGVPVAVDSTFATPILQRPIELGVDLVLHSATKYLGGHSDLIGGVVAGAAEPIARIKHRRRALGGILDPFSAFLLLRGMRTLAVRMEAHCRGAAEVARFLERHERVERVLYPGLERHPDLEIVRRQMSGPGGMVSFTVGGGDTGARAVHDRLRLFARAGSLGGVESLVSIPARMSHRHQDPATRARMGVPDDMLRLSVGLEDPADLIEDLDRALR